MSTSLTINISEANKTLPAALEARLTSTPTKSPDELAVELAAHAQRTAALRRAHLENVRERAEVATRRAGEAIARKLRAQEAAKAKVQRKLDFAATKTEAKREANEAEREARKAHREGLALAVAEARKANSEAKLLRQKEYAEAEAAASTKHAKQVHEVMAKGATAVKHALAVAHAHKAKEAAEAAERGEALASKLAAADVRRELLSSPAAEHATGTRLHRVRNEDKVLSQMRRVLHESSMAKASEKREAHLLAVTEKARAEIQKVAAVAAKVKSMDEGTDAATVGARAALYEKLLNAEIGRLHALKAKVDASKLLKGDTVSVIVVRLDDVLSPRAPPLGLIKRLAVKGGSLLATAASRQAGAFSRRAELKHARFLAVAKANERRAAAGCRVAKVAAALAAKAKAKAAGALVTRALAQGKLAHKISQQHRRFIDAALKRTQFASAVEQVGQMKSAKGAAADERRAKALRLVAKTGVVAVRHAAAKSRRDAARATVVARGESNTARSSAAAAKKAAIVAQKVVVAKKRMVAAHPKREVADMEIKATSSEA